MHPYDPIILKKLILFGWAVIFHQTDAVVFGNKNMLSIGY